MKRWIVLGLMVLMAHCITTAQNIRRFRQFDINQGLAHTDATDVVEDENGFIWVGTNAGVQRFDGRQTKLFFNTTSKQNQVYNNRITSIFAARENLWIGSEGGVHLFNLRQEKHVPLNYLGMDFTNDPAVVPDLMELNGQIWFRCNDNIYRGIYNPDTKELRIENLNDLALNVPERFKLNLKVSLTTNGDNVLWVGTNNGVFSFTVYNDEVELLEIAEPKEPGLVFAQNRANHMHYINQQLWMISPDYLQVFSLSNSDYKFRNTLKTIRINDVFKGTEFENEINSINNFTVDNDNNFWCGTSAGLIFIEEPLSENERYQLFTSSQYDPFSISSNNVNGVMLDHSNCLWASTWAGGLSYIDLEQKQFNLLVKNPAHPEKSLSEAFVRSITQDHLGRVWIGGQNEGLDLYYPESGICKPFRLGNLSNESLTSTKIRCLKYSDKKIYAGTTMGLNIIDLKTNQIYTYPEIVGVSNAIYSMDFDSHGNLWLGTWKGGLFQVKLENNQPAKVLQITENRQNTYFLSSSQVNFVFADNAKNEVLAGTKSGLNRIILGDSGSINNIIYYGVNESESSLSSEYIWPITKENDTTYWLGTLGGGLNKFVLLDGWDKNHNGNYKAKSFSVLQGAPSNDIETLLTDNSGNLWIGSKGISSFNPQTEEFWNFDVNDGLQSNGFKIGSSFKNKEGILFFGGIKGLNHFSPQNIKRNTIKPRVVINNIRIKNQEIQPGQVLNKRIVLENGLAYTNKIELNYKENDFTLSLASLHYSNPEKCRYKYKLEGYEDEWHFISGDYPLANYSNLEYGTYKFLADGTNNDGLWNGVPVELQISVNPPWWLSNAAYIGYFILFMAIVFGIFYYTTRWMKLRNNLKLVEAEEKKKEELHQMKLQFFMNISHEFKTPLTLILTPLEKLQNRKLDENEQNRMLRMISVNANRMLKLINELMDFRKAEVGHLKLITAKGNPSEFAENIFQQFIPLCQKSELEYSFKSETSAEIWFDNEKMSTILYNLLANSINNTEAGGKVEVEIFQSAYRNLNPYFENKYEVYNEISENNYLYIRVKDTGIGITKKSINQIFDRFYHINSKNSKHLGTGIGLALLKNLVLLHHGHIVVSSERFKGTEFLVGFPLGDSHLLAEEKGLESADMLQIQIEDDDCAKKMPAINLNDNPTETKTLATLLLVEDNTDLRDVLHEHFANNYNVIEASNGKEALEKLLDNNVDLIISDIMMPEIDGLELVKILRNDIKTSHLPIALLTAKSSVEDQIAGTEAGADLYFPKPFNLRLMDLRIKQFIDSREKLRNSFASNVFAETRELARTQKDKEFIDRFVELVDENIDNNDFSIDQICLELSIGRTNLYKKVRSLTGQSMGEFIRGFRLKKAARILVTEDVSISEVLYRVGINSNSYFTKSFKAQFGMTPTEFIQQNVGRYN